MLSLALGVHSRTARAEDTAPSEVVLVVVDTLRADRVDAVIDAGDAPYLAQLRAAGVRFSNAHASSSWTPTSMASLMTAREPHEHGVRTGLLAVQPGEHDRDGPPPDRVPDQFPTLAERLRAAGYTTFGFVDNLNAGTALGLDRGFVHFEEAMYEGAPRLAQRVLRAAQKWQAAPRRFLYVHFMDPHAPYHARSQALGRRVGGAALARYDSEIVHVDRALARLARRLGFGDDTLIVFTADHGEAFGEHGEHGHPNHLYAELLRVPLVFHWPAARTAGQRDEPVSTLDLVPTLLELLALPPDARAAGSSLAPLLRGQKLRDRALFARRWSLYGPGALERRAVIAAGFKCVQTLPSGRVELFDLESDPAERRDLSRHEPERVRRMLERMDNRERERPPAPRAPAPAGNAPSDSVQKKLRALGYAL